MHGDEGIRGPDEVPEQPNKAYDENTPAKSSAWVEKMARRSRVERGGGGSRHDNARVGSGGGGRCCAACVACAGGGGGCLAPPINDSVSGGATDDADAAPVPNASSTWTCHASTTISAPDTTAVATLASASTLPLPSLSTSLTNHPCCCIGPAVAGLTSSVPSTHFRLFFVGGSREHTHENDAAPPPAPPSPPSSPLPMPNAGPGILPTRSPELSLTQTQSAASPLTARSSFLHLPARSPQAREPGESLRLRERDREREREEKKFWRALGRAAALFFE